VGAEGDRLSDLAGQGAPPENGTGSAPGGPVLSLDRVSLSFGGLRALSELELHVGEGEIVSFHGFPFPTRSVIVRLASGNLWVWSPIRLVPELRADLERLGPVRHLVSPNKMHHLYLQGWSAAYPQAQLWGPQSTIRKRSTSLLEWSPTKPAHLLTGDCLSSIAHQHVQRGQRC